MIRQGWDRKEEGTLDELFNCRYGDCLERVLNRLGFNGVEDLIEASYTNDYQGDVSIVTKLADGRIFTYDYSYGSCTACDDWEARDLTDAQIETEMLASAVIYTPEQWKEKHP